MKIYKSDVTLIDTKATLNNTMGIYNTKTFYKIEVDPDELYNRSFANNIELVFRNKKIKEIRLKIVEKVHESLFHNRIILDESTTDILITTTKENAPDIFNFLFNYYFMLHLNIKEDEIKNYYDNNSYDADDIAFFKITELFEKFSGTISNSSMIDIATKILKDGGASFNLFESSILKLITRFKDSTHAKFVMDLPKFLKHEMFLSKLIHYKKLVDIRDFVGLNLLKTYKKDILMIDDMELSKTVKLVHSYKKSHPELYI